jgi:Family of unknown function (DUF5677)
MDDGDKTNTWKELLAWKPEFPSLVHKWLEIIRRLVIKTALQDEDLIGHSIVGFIAASLSDVNDLMAHTCNDSHHGAQKILRTVFERIVTLKYISENTGEAKRFMDYDAIDSEQVITGIHAITGLELQGPERTRLLEAAARARKDYKQEKCPSCKKPKYLGWSSLNSKDMTNRVELGHMHLHAFLLPSKLIHPTYWGLREVASKSSPMINTLNCTHELMVQAILIHRRHFTGRLCTPLMAEAIRDFLSIWVYSGTSFGGILPEERQWTTAIEFIIEMSLFASEAQTRAILIYRRQCLLSGNDSGRLEKDFKLP